MANINFPETLYRAVSNSFIQGFIDNRIQDDRDAGVFNARVVTTKTNLTFEYSIVINQEQVEVLKHFYKVTTEGVKIFNWIHPISGDIYEAVFDVPPTVTTNVSDSQTVNIAITTV